MTDINPFSVSIFLSDLFGDQIQRKGIFGFGTESSRVKEAHHSTWFKNATLFKRNGKLGVKRTITFTHTRDLECVVSYNNSDSLPIGTELSIEHHNITGITEFSEQYSAKEFSKPKVSLQFEMSISGLIRLLKAEAIVEETRIVKEEILVENVQPIDTNHNVTKNVTESVVNSISHNDSNPSLNNNISSTFQAHNLFTNATSDIFGQNNTRIITKATNKITKNIQKEQRGCACEALSVPFEYFS
jgi:hypothetical protein